MKIAIFSQSATLNHHLVSYDDNFSAVKSSISQIFTFTNPENSRSEVPSGPRKKLFSNTQVCWTIDNAGDADRSLRLRWTFRKMVFLSRRYDTMPCETSPQQLMESH